MNSNGKDFECAVCVCFVYVLSSWIDLFIYSELNIEKLRRNDFSSFQLILLKFILTIYRIKH